LFVTTNIKDFIEKSNMNTMTKKRLKECQDSAALFKKEEEVVK